jgi:hypothetical protein
MREISKMVVWEEREDGQGADHRRHVSHHHGCGCAATAASGRGCLSGGRWDERGEKRDGKGEIAYCTCTVNYAGISGGMSRKCEKKRKGKKRKKKSM